MLNSKITFLGTAGDSFVAGKQLRASGGIIIKVGENQLHLNPGPGAVVRAAQFGINLRENTAILITNNNLINCSDLNAVIDAMTYGGLDKTGVLMANKTIINGEDQIRPYLTKLHEGFFEKIITIAPKQRVAIEDIEIDIIPSLAEDPNAVGFKISTNDFILGYPSDGKYVRDIAKEYKGCDILILNVVSPGDEKEEFKLNTESAIKFIKEVNPQLTIITHFGIKMVKLDPINEGREIQKQTGVKVLVAKDGLSFTPDSYSAQSRQKRLNMFKDQDTGIVKEQEINLEEEQEQPKIEENPAEEVEEEKQEHLDF
jgi:hypothetical protein